MFSLAAHKSPSLISLSLIVSCLLCFYHSFSHRPCDFFSYFMNKGRPADKKTQKNLTWRSKLNINYDDNDSDNNKTFTYEEHLKPDT
jgi:hypothetical protein